MLGVGAALNALFAELGFVERREVVHLLGPRRRLPLDARRAGRTERE